MGWTAAHLLEALPSKGVNLALEDNILGSEDTDFSAHLNFRLLWQWDRHRGMKPWVGEEVSISPVGVHFQAFLHYSQAPGGENISA